MSLDSNENQVQSVENAEVDGGIQSGGQAAVAAQEIRLVRDNSGHWFAIPAHLNSEFEMWVDWSDSMEGANPVLFDFDATMLGRHPSNYVFTGMREG